MKSLQLITFILFFAVVSGKTQVVIATDLLTTLYVGIDNPISIAVVNVRPKDIVLKCDNGTVKKISDTKYSVKICSTTIGKTVLRVFNKSKLIEKREVRVRPVPNPTLLTCSQNDEIMFKGCQGVRADIKDFYMEGIVSKVNKFRITIIKNTGDTLTIENGGAYYQTAAQNSFDALNVGETILLSNFEVSVGCETEPRRLTTVLTSVYSGKKREFRY